MSSRFLGWKRFWPYEDRVREYLGRGAEHPVGRVVQPEEQGAPRGILMLPNEREKVLRPHWESTLDREFERLRPNRPRHSAVVAYELENALVHEGGVSAANGFSHKIGRVRSRFLWGRPIEQHDRVVVAATASTARYFGHWVWDGASTALLAEEGERVALPTHRSWRHADELAPVLRLGLLPRLPVFARRAVFFVDHGQGSSKRARYRILRKRLRAALDDRPGPRCVYLRRGDKGAKARRFANSDALESALCAKGFTVVDHTEYSALELAHRLKDAEVVVSAEGSHLAHPLLAAPDGAWVVAIVGADRFTAVLGDITEAFGLRFAMCVSTPDGAGQHTVDIDGVLRTLDAAAGLPPGNAQSGTGGASSFVRSQSAAPYPLP